MQTLAVPAAVINSTILVCLSPFNYTTISCNLWQW